jgi:uncharacterized membrane protein
MGVVGQQHLKTCISDRPSRAETVQTAHSAARKLITSLVGSFAFLMLVAVAAWIVISSGAGHPTWQ